MSEITLSKQIYSGYRISITVFTYLPKVVVGYNGTSHTVSTNPIMMITYKPPKGAQTNLKQNYFKVTPKNLFRTILFFNKLVEWFYSDDMKDLFLRDEKNGLIFNGDYNKLKLITKSDSNNTMAMKAVPSVIRYDNGKDYEGVYLYINKVENVVPLPLSELEDVLGILKVFSFESTIVEMIQSYYYAKDHGTITSDDYRGDYNNASQKANQWK